MFYQRKRSREERKALSCWNKGRRKKCRITTPSAVAVAVAVAVVAAVERISGHP